VAVCRSREASGHSATLELPAFPEKYRFYWFAQPLKGQPVSLLSPEPQQAMWAPPVGVGTAAASAVSRWISLAEKRRPTPGDDILSPNRALRAAQRVR